MTIDTENQESTMTILDRLDQLEKDATPGPWRFAQMLDGIEARMLISGTGYHFGRIDDLESGAFISAFRNSARALIDVAMAANKFVSYPHTIGIGKAAYFHEMIKEALSRLEEAK